MELKEITVNPMEHGLQNKVVSSMLLDPDNFVTNVENLQYYVNKSESLTLFLRSMGILWASNNDNAISYAFQLVWNVFVRCSLGYMLFEAIFIAVVNTLHSSTEIGRLLWVLLGITFALQSITLMFSLYDINNRLKSKVSHIVVQHLNAGLNSSYLVLIICLFMSTVPFIIGFAVESNEVSLYIALMLANISAGIVLTAAMYFIALDCVVAISLLDQLLEQQKLELLTCEQFAMARDEINQRRSSSAWINGSIVIVALLDICCVLLFCFVNLLDGNLEGYLIVTGLFLKEIPFLMVVFWKVAQVNEKSALLVRNLGDRKWSLESHSDHERMAVYIKAQSNPIVMSLAGMKLKRKDLAWQFALWCIAFVVSFLKAAVAQRVE